MPRSKTPSFVVELLLKVSPSDSRELGIRLEMERQLYNASLGEALRTLGLVRQSRAFQAARKLSKGKERTEAFRVVNDRYGFTSSQIQSFATRCQKECPSIALHTTSHDMQTTSKRAFKAVQRHAFGKGGRPRFKGYRELNSVEGKMDACITFRPDEKTGQLLVKWDGLVLPVVWDDRDLDNWMYQALAEHATKYIRILRKKLRGKDFWYAQLIQEGTSPMRSTSPVGNCVIGLDIGPSTIAAVSDTDATLETFCPSVEVPAAEIRREQRKMDRSRRVTNPECFNENGTYKKGTRIKVRSEGYMRIRAKKAEKERKLAAERKRSHGELCNRILAQGTTIHTEKLSYKGWQRGRYGKSVGKRAPGMFVSLLRQKAKGVGGEVVEFSTRTTKLSQVDHKTGLYTKKPLSQRGHIFQDGTRVQRDLYSAFLARFVNNDTLDISQCHKAWASAEPLLGCAMSSGNEQGASREGFVRPHAIRGNTSDVRAACTSKQRRELREVVDAVIAVQAAVRATKNTRSQAASSSSLSGGT